jgi:hypothetical protein
MNSTTPLPRCSALLVNTGPQTSVKDDRNRGRRGFCRHRWGYGAARHRFQLFSYGVGCLSPIGEQANDVARGHQLAQ